MNVAGEKYRRRENRCIVRDRRLLTVRLFFFYVTSVGNRSRLSRDVRGDHECAIVIVTSAAAATTTTQYRGAGSEQNGDRTKSRAPLGSRRIMTSRRRWSAGRSTTYRRRKLRPRCTPDDEPDCEYDAREITSAVPHRRQPRKCSHCETHLPQIRRPSPNPVRSPSSLNSVTVVPE